MAPVWVAGSTGQLGFYLTERLTDSVSVPKGTASFLRKPGVIPRALINATAYNFVDRAETDREACWDLNVEYPRTMAKWAAENQVPFMHFSTDFVYSGEGDQPWRESDVPHPLNYYAESKLGGEKAVLEAYPMAAVIRTSWVYSHRRENFVLAILKRAREKGELTVVNDQVGSPTFADELAANTLRLMEHPEFLKTSARIWHLSDSGYVSRFDFARGIIEEASRFEPELSRCKISPVKTADFKSPAKRPLNSRLSLERAAKFGIKPRPWRENLRLCLERFYGHH